ncbi:MAG TPA: hypothetical protein HA360_05225 [Nanoarchaeota archaeon]|nr:hypothetical protein [Candidatus Woesearchaeota archaeon]HIH14789.1 hypothetical protein [Nanoarchaeota archaeon]HII14448.1 hypothetical protein [Nanoarchaeota archaeon]HIJ04930.1 hypothetical protein [Nanoarchaeota archaeon]
MAKTLTDTEKKVLGYIRDYESKGYSDAKIKEALTKSGISSATISKCMKVAHPSVFRSPYFWFGLVVLIGLIFAVVFFLPGEEEVKCSFDRDCGRGYSCSDGDCIKELEEDVEESISLEEEEEELFVFGGECDSYSDCGYGETCANGSCVDFFCDTDEECEEEFSTHYGCSFDICVKKGPAESSGGAGSNGTDSSESGSSDGSGSGSALGSVENTCDDGIDGDADGSIDSTGGCDVSADGEIDYACGCYIASTGSFTSYKDCTLEPLECTTLCDSATELYGCKNLETSIIDPSQICTGLGLMSSSSGSVYYSADSDCPNSDNSIVSSEDVSCGIGYVCEGAYACDIATEICYNSCTEEGQCNDGYTCDNDVCVGETLEEDVVVEIHCDDSIDDDGDGNVDCDDSDCATDSVCVASIEDVCTDVLPGCADGVDNDGDGESDLDDSECSSWADEEFGIDCTVDADCEVTESCDVGVCVEICPDGFFDNTFYNSNEEGNYSHNDYDGDGDVFCLDADEICHETDGGKNYTLAGISTGLAYYTNTNVPYDYEDSCVTDADHMNQAKNSSDTLREYYCEDILVRYEAVACTCENDACVSEEVSLEDCDNSVDDDGDTLVDCLDDDCIDDSDCESVLVVSEAEDCADNIDNDGDGTIDCDDSDCEEDSGCDDEIPRIPKVNFGSNILFNECESASDCADEFSGEPDCWSCVYGSCIQILDKSNPDCDQYEDQGPEESTDPYLPAPAEEEKAWKKFLNFLVKGYSSIAETDKYKAPEQSTLEYLRDY